MVPGAVRFVSLERNARPFLRCWCRDRLPLRAPATGVHKKADPCRDIAPDRDSRARFLHQDERNKTAALIRRIEAQQEESSAAILPSCESILRCARWSAIETIR